MVYIDGYISIFVKDLERSRKFYEAILGFKVVLTTPTGNFILFDAGGIPFALYRESAASNVTPTKIGDGSDTPKFCLSLQVDDVDSVYIDLKSKGVEFLDEPTDWFFGERAAHFYDLDRNLIRIFKQISRKR